MALSSITRGKGKAVAEEIYDTLTLLLRDTFEDRSLVARPEMTADDVDVWDSIGQIRLILAVERAFGTPAAVAASPHGPIATARNWRTVTKLLELATTED